MAPTDSRLQGRLPLGAGTTAGTAAWVAGYVLTYALTSDRIQENVVRQLVDIPTWKVAGWVFYNAHAVPTVFEGLFGGTVNFVGGDRGFTVALYLVPVVLLVAAGFLVGRTSEVDRVDAANAAVAGATVVLGYGVLSLLGLVLFAEGDAHPDYVLSVALPALSYPLVLGAVGASLARYA